MEAKWGRVWRWLRSGLAAGACLGILDFGTGLPAASRWRTCAALFELDLLAGVVAAMVTLGALALGDALHARLRSVPRAVIDGALVAVPAVGVGLELFSGAGIRRTMVGTVGPWLLPCLAWCLASVCAWWVRQKYAAEASARYGLCAGAASLAGLCLALDQNTRFSTYACLRVLAVSAASLCLTLLLRVTLDRVPLRRSRVAAGGVVVALGLAPLMGDLLRDNAVRAAFAEHQPYAERVVSALSWATDLANEGARQVLTGGVNAKPTGSECREGGVRRSYGGSRQSASEVAQLAKGRPTVVLVIDALRADRIGRPGFPALERFASESVVFANAMAPASSTTLSVPAMITGSFVPTSKTLSVFERLAKVGRTSGLATVDIVPKTISGEFRTPASRTYPMVRGVKHVALVPTEHRHGVWGGGVDSWTDPEVTKRAFALLDATNPPDLLWVHYFDLHQWAMLPDLNERGVARYDAVLRRVDQELARWIARGDELNLIVVADHGEGLGEHGVGYHTRWLWHELVHVPLMLRVPGLRPSRVDTFVSTADLAPTLLDLHGVEIGAEAAFSLLTLVGVAAPHGATLLAFDLQHISLLEGQHRLIFDTKNRATWLFDERADPLEKHNLSATLSGLNLTMLQQLSCWQRTP